MLINNKLMDRLRDAFYPVYSWTVGEFESMTYVVEPGKYAFDIGGVPMEGASDEDVRKYEMDVIKAKFGMRIRKICNVTIKVTSCEPKKTRGKTAYAYNCLVCFHNKSAAEAQFSAKDFTSAKLFCAALMGQTPGGCFYGNNKDLEEYKKVLLNDLEKVPCK